MGLRGPAPRESSVTRHQPKQQAKNMTAPKPVVPNLVGEYDMQTLAWWDAWVSSPQSEHFAATDWQTLLRLAPLMKMYFEKPTPQLAAEIRQTEAKLGATAADRDRLGWKITPPLEPDGDVADDARDRPDPRSAK